MVQITVTDELARAIAEAGPLVTLVDSRGRAVGQITPVGPDHPEKTTPLGMTAENWEEIERRMQNPGEYVNFEQIKERLGW